ncbi:MAG: GAF domain-containing protein [Candidatus Binatia bacterium]
MSPSIRQLPIREQAPHEDMLESSRARVHEVLASTERDPAARERQIAFQVLIAELATGFVGRTGSELDAELGRSLERIATFVGAERAGLVAIANPSELLTVTHEWASDNQPAVLRSVHGQRAMRWSVEQLRRGTILRFEDASQFPDEAVEEKAAWAVFGIQSILVLPVRVRDGDLLGFAAFATTTRKAVWRDEERPLFDLVAEMLRSAFEQQRFRAQLERSELRLHKLLESGAIGILSADSDGRIWEANDAALLVVGASRADMEAGRLRWDQLTPAEYLPMTMGALEQLERSGCSEPWEQDIYRADGTRVSILVCTARIAERPEHFLIYAVDITADKRAERELSLRHRLARLITLFSTRLISVAPSRIGETIEEALRETGGVLGVDRCSVWLDVEESGTVSRLEYVWDRVLRHRRPDDPMFFDRASYPAWNDDFRNRRPMVVRDSARDYAEGSLERAYLDTHGVRSGVAVALLGAEHPIGFVNFGVDRVMDWPEATVSLLCVIGEILAAAIVRGRIEEKQRRVHAELEERIAERTLQLESANRELEAFSYAVSHDLRAPLRSVDGFSRILVEDLASGLPPAAKDVLDRIRATSQRMGELIDSLLRLSRITRSEPQFERTDLSAITRELAAALAAADPARCVEFRIEDGVVVDGEPRLLSAMMDNLLRNAWKFTAPKPSARIEFGTAHEAGRRVFFLRDDGVGFDPSQAERLFTPFQQLHDPRDFGGHGVGLATVKRIVGVHGGRVWGEGEPGMGATIHFTLGDREQQPESKSRKAG